jgi:hypothetical protein
MTADVLGITLVFSREENRNNCGNGIPFSVFYFYNLKLFINRIQI